MSDYKVTVKRWNRGWELHIDGVGVTQARNLGEADEMVRDYIAIMEGDEAAASAHVNYSYELSAVKKIERARNATREAERLSARAAAESREAVAELAAEGVSGADMSRLLALSPQRVSQLVAAARAGLGAPVTAKRAGKTIGKAPARTAAKSVKPKAPKRGSVEV